MTEIKVVCPCCEGTGKSRVFEDASCLWCRGTAMLSRAEARRYADTKYTLAGGGYIGGDYSREEAWKKEAEASAIYKMLGEIPPWEKKGE